MNSKKFNLPILVSEWRVKYQPLPLMKKKGLTHFLATDLIESSTSFSDENLREYIYEKYDITLPVQLDYNIDNYGWNMLKNYYMHQKKSWSYPEVEKVTEYIVYLPYIIEESDKKIYLVEEKTGMKKKISRKNKIYELLKRG
ncbi:hypothetical protein LNK15_02580 [Jeotgalicoccus huakuii]|nr:hypothetical protein [Jeotgalicoccus huakuii]